MYVKHLLQHSHVGETNHYFSIPMSRETLLCPFPCWGHSYFSTPMLGELLPLHSNVGGSLLTFPFQCWELLLLHSHVEETLTPMLGKLLLSIPMLGKLLFLNCHVGDTSLMHVFKLYPLLNCQMLYCSIYWLFKTNTTQKNFIILNKCIKWKSAFQVTQIPQ